MGEGIKVTVERTLPNYSMNFTYNDTNPKTKLHQVHDHLEKMTLMHIGEKDNSEISKSARLYGIEEIDMQK
jgi:hypothetical protein